MPYLFISIYGCGIPINKPSALNCDSSLFLAITFSTVLGIYDDLSAISFAFKASLTD